MGSYLSTEELNEDYKLYQESRYKKVQKNEPKTLTEHMSIVNRCNYEDLELENKMLRESLNKYKKLYYDSIQEEN